MSRPIMLSCSLALTLLATAVLPGSSSTSRKLGWPAFDTDGYTLTCMEYEATSKMAFSNQIGKERIEHEIELKGTITRPTDVDAVAFTLHPTIVDARDAQRRSLLPIASSAAGLRSARGTQPEKFASFNGGHAGFEVERGKLDRNPYLVNELMLRGNVIIASEREHLDVPAQVMRELVDAPGGLKVRLSMLRISRTGKASFTAEYERMNTPGAPFIEALFILDEKGEPFAGGRWNKGASPMSEKGDFRCDFEVDTRVKFDKVRVVVLTRYKVEPVEFTLDGIFQR